MFLQQQAYVANIVQFECFPISWTQTHLFVCILYFSKHSRRLLLAKIAHILFQLQQCLMLTLCVFELLPLFIYNKRHLLKSPCALLIAYCRAYQGFRAALSLSIACCFSSRTFSSVFKPSFLIRSSVRSADALIRFWRCRWRFWREVSRRAANNSLKESTLSRSVMGCALKITRSISPTSASSRPSAEQS